MILKRLIAIVNRSVSVIFLTLLYSIALIINFICRPFSRAYPLTQKRIFINGTFHNPNWFFAHIEPIVRSGYGEVVLVCDEPVADLPGLRYACPPRWVVRILSRAGAKFLWTFGLGLRHGADLFMGYHIFPSAVTALICARLLGARAVYQVTSGPLELEGGGWHAENRLLTALGHPSLWVERLAFAVTQCFDLVVVRGSIAARYVRTRVKFNHNLEIITGSVDSRNELMKDSRDIDVIFVGRLTEYKRPDRLIKVLALVVSSVPTLRAVFVGDGPDSADLKSQASALGIKDHIKFLGQRNDVPELMGRAKVFALTSRWEGVSIAMLEAMVLGVVPVVSNVGDLHDFVKDNVTGFILDADDLHGFSDRISRLLCDEPFRVQLAHNARKRVIARCDKEILAQRWKEVLVETISGNKEGGKEENDDH